MSERLVRCAAFVAAFKCHKAFGQKVPEQGSHMSEPAPSRRIIRALLAVALMMGGASALSTVQPAAAWADGIHCNQVAYEPGPWGTEPGLYKSCQDGQGNHVLPPDGSNDAWDYMHRPR
jgi:hypothetical protein